jgi:hypothetical protein
MNGGEELTGVRGKLLTSHGSAQGRHGEREGDEGELTTVLFVDQEGVEVARSLVGQLGYSGLTGERRYGHQIDERSGAVDAACPHESNYRGFGDGDGLHLEDRWWWT